jgi:hypothetical protein
MNKNYLFSLLLFFMPVFSTDPFSACIASISTEFFTMETEGEFQSEDWDIGEITSTIKDADLGMETWLAKYETSYCRKITFGYTWESEMHPLSSVVTSPYKIDNDTIEMKHLFKRLVFTTRHFKPGEQEALLKKGLIKNYTETNSHEVKQVVASVYPQYHDWLPQESLILKMKLRINHHNKRCFSQ